MKDILTATINRMPLLHLLSTAMVQAELFQGNHINTVALSIMLNSFPSISLSVCSTIKQNNR